ncbi:hypothetical protein [Flavobacterium lacisediminis]|uniref:Uncharacterized protein n=1 Tax=Flavobacterium lacisediminis TaxID=2989705 RepID=A0ABT3EKV9_9FLAO|nr:hypothetical protein [Flavobacterium lacisediminis]MCW1149193.1 hypothetical protein [Flavobacterium lacisediminis]
MIDVLIEQTNSAIEELSISLKSNISFETLVNWININKEIELETLKYTCEENKFGDFWSLFYWIDGMIKFFSEKEIIEDCIGEFNNLDKQNTDNVYSFLIKYEPLLKNFSISKSLLLSEQNSKLQQVLNSFMDFSYFKNAKYLHDYISSKVIMFFYLKNMQKLDENKLKEEIGKAYLFL